MKFSLALLLLTQSFILSASGQAKDPTSLFPGYEPTVLESLSSAQQLFSQMPQPFIEGSIVQKPSQCFHRAEIWAYDFYVNHEIKPMKAFVFYTHTLKSLMAGRVDGAPLGFWFHTTPYVLVRDQSTGTVKELAMDGWYTKGPTDLATWADLFVISKKPCAEYVPYEVFREEVEGNWRGKYGTEHCYIVRAPGMDLDPKTASARERGEKAGYEWDPADLEVSILNSVKKKEQITVRALLGLQP